MVATLVSKILIVVGFAQLCKGLQLRMKPSMFLRDSEDCVRHSKSPYFDIDLVVGKPWRIYYTWNVFMEDQCMDITVKNATHTTVNRVYHDMHEYLEAQPAWEAASLHVTMGTASHELLLFVDQGAAGRFLGVPNVVRDGDIAPIRNTVPLLKFFLKLLNNGKYLLMIDCQIGVASLMSRERPPYKVEVASLARSLNLGMGQHACIADRKKDEQFLN